MLFRKHHLDRNCTMPHRIAPSTPSRAHTLACSLGLSAALALTPFSALAQDKKAELPSSFQKLAQCRAITDDTARLACFDKESGVLITAANEGEVKVVNREEAKTMRKSLFGFSLPDIAIFGDDDDEAKQDVEKLSSTITKVTALPSGYWRVTIADGNAVWESTGKRRGMIAPKVGNKIEFEPAALGTYWMRVNGQLGVKARRVN